jgi:hypothetical protein
MQIFVPSIDRAELFSQCTGKFLKEAGLADITYLVVPKDQKKEYRKLNPDFNIIHIPEYFESRGIGVKRQYILDTYADEFSFQVDDDLRFYKREGNKTSPATGTDISSMFLLLESWLQEEDVALTSTGVRYMFQARGDFHENAPCIHVLGIKKSVFLENKIRFDAIPMTSDDIYVSLAVLVSGYKSRITDLYLQEGKPMNYAGGISRYRNAGVINKSVRALQQAFPKFVLYRKDIEIKNIGTVLATTIKWKKAYEYGHALRKLKGGLFK